MAMCIHMYTFKDRRTNIPSHLGSLLLESLGVVEADFYLIDALAIDRVFNYIIHTVVAILKILWRSRFCCFRCCCCCCCCFCC